MVDREGLLWAVSIVADEHWKAMPTPPEGRNMRSVPELEERFDSMIEVIDINRREVIGSKRIPGIVVGVFGAGSLAMTRETADGDVVVVVMRVSMSGPGAR